MCISQWSEVISTKGVVVLIQAFILVACMSARAASAGSPAGESLILKPHITEDWWQVAGDPELGKLTTRDQQPVDFGIWQAASWLPENGFSSPMRT